MFWRFVFIILINLSLVSFVHAETRITQDIESDTTWTKENGPYIVENSIAVLDTATLRIESGVEVSVQSSFTVLGKIVVEGIVDDPVSISSVAGISIISPQASSFIHTRFSLGNDVFLTGTSLSIADSSFQGGRGISGYDSDVFLVRSSFQDLEASAVSLFGGSHLEMNTVELSRNASDAISIFNESTAIIVDSIFMDCMDACVSVFNGSSVSIDNSSFDGGSDGISVFNGSTLNLEDSRISGMLNSGLFVFGQEGVNTISLTKNEIKENLYGLLLINQVAVAQFSKNSIHDNLEYGAVAFNANPIDLSDTWWGDRSGPLHIHNPEGVGNQVSDSITVSTFLRRDPFVETRDPVIIIPGIMGSRIIQDYGEREELWPNANKLVRSLTDSFMSDLGLDENGQERAEYPTVLGDIIRSETVTLEGEVVHTDHVFDGMIGDLIADGYVEEVDLFVFPYDWRYSNAVTAEKLKIKIDEILENSDAEKVDLVTHSMGGLVAKKYIAEYGSEKVDQVFFIGVPHLGAPKAFKALMYGDDMGFNKFGYSLLSNTRIKELAQNISSLFELLPSKKYVDDLGKRYVGINEQSTGLINIPLIYDYFDYTSTREFLETNNKNKVFLANSEEFHNEIDSIDLSGVRVYNFSGCGIPTLDAVKHKKKKILALSGIKTIDDYELSFTSFGDQTVPLASSKIVEGNQYYVRGVSHGSLPYGASVRGVISSLLVDESVSSYENLSTSETLCAGEGMRVVSIHSPVKLHIYDEAGNHVGPIENGIIEYEIPNITYEIIEGVKYIALPGNGNYRFVLEAEDMGSFDVYAELFDGAGMKTNEVYWSQIPIENKDLKGELILAQNFSESVLSIDSDGDGVTDTTFSANTVKEIDQTESGTQISPSIGVVIPIVSHVERIEENLPPIFEKETIETKIAESIKDSSVSQNKSFEVTQNDTQEKNVIEEPENKVEPSMITASAEGSSKFYTLIFIGVIGIIALVWIVFKLLFKV